MTKHRGMSRRRLLKVGGLGALGLTLPGLLRAEADRVAGGTAGRCAARGLAPIRSCILVFYYGGPSHIDTYDMKPKAPAEVRGEFGSIATSVPGLRVCEHLPHTARVMDRLAIAPGDAPPDDQPQRGGVRDAVRPQPGQGRPRDPEQRPQRPAVLRRGA